VHSYRNFQIIRHRINGILLYLNVLLHIICVCACVLQVLSEETFSSWFLNFYIVFNFNSRRKQDQVALVLW
jgi:hypothetical protein